VAIETAKWLSDSNYWQISLLWCCCTSVWYCSGRQMLRARDCGWWLGMYWISGSGYGQYVEWHRISQPDILLTYVVEYISIRAWMSWNLIRSFIFV